MLINTYKMVKPNALFHGTMVAANYENTRGYSRTFHQAFGNTAQFRREGGRSTFHNYIKI